MLSQCSPAGSLRRRTASRQAAMRTSPSSPLRSSIRVARSPPTAFSRSCRHTSSVRCPSCRTLSLSRSPCSTRRCATAACPMYRNRSPLIFKDVVALLEGNWCTGLIPSFPSSCIYLHSRPGYSEIIQAVTIVPIGSRQGDGREVSTQQQLQTFQSATLSK